MAHISERAGMPGLRGAGACPRSKLWHWMRAEACAETILCNPPLAALGRSNVCMHTHAEGTQYAQANSHPVLAQGHGARGRGQAPDMRTLWRWLQTDSWPAMGGKDGSGCCHMPRRWTPLTRSSSNGRSQTPGKHPLPGLHGPYISLCWPRISSPSNMELSRADAGCMPWPGLMGCFRCCGGS